VRIVLAGSMGRLPVGGYAWMDMQWLAGLHGLGHEVLYVEDCGEQSWVYDWDREEVTNRLEYPAGFVAACLESIGLGNRWAYRTSEASMGLPDRDVIDFCAAADLLIVHGVPLASWRPEYTKPARTAFVDVDPGFTQIRLANGDADLSETASHCDRFFTIGQRIGEVDCPIPTNDLAWVRTVPPIALQHWPATPPPDGGAFTCVMQWRGHHDVEHDGVRYGQKDAEFPKFIDLPRRTTQPLRLAVTGKAPEELEAHGWHVVPGWEPSRTPWTYQQFIQGSRAEFSVAKHGYVASRGGWFSDRSLCYLATGRPVLVEDTGLRHWLPVGEGVVTFDDLAGAVAGIDAINADYEAHSAAARRLAEEVFAADLVLPPVLDAAMA
jgi:hypothetical protein